ncbi:MAG: phosphatase PAP2 family protein [Candidatus Heimdallarchaeota archaeon]|nr:phosphatase PAP2 family protein [Candidatus Heimdallarchaeota archaeon]
MSEPTLPWNMEWMDWIVSHRSPFLTPIFYFFTLLGELNPGYVFIIAALYVMVDKKIGFRIAMVAVIASTANHILKIIIRNPRPYANTTYKDVWIVPDPEQTVTEFSTPSGHAMGASSFWGYLYNQYTNKYLRIAFVFTIFMIGLSRPYLGVHFFEDIILGWILGALLVLIFIKYEEQVAEVWKKLTFKNQIIITIVSSVIIWNIGGLATSWGVDGETFATNTGFLTGFLIGRHLELHKINFDAKSGTLVQKILRLLITVILTILVMEGLSAIFDLLADDYTWLAFLLRYIRYSLTGFTAIYLSPVVFNKLKLVEAENTESNL